VEKEATARDVYRPARSLLLNAVSVKEFVFNI
jgi:hypothetical protein